MPTNKYQVSYWKNCCDNCVLGTTIQSCIRPDDMGVKGDANYALQGCLLAYARRVDIDPDTVTEAVLVIRHNHKKHGEVITFVRNEAFYEVQNT